MSQEEVDVKLSGVSSASNPFSSPEGSTEVSDNVIQTGQDLYEPRRGYYASAPNPSGTNDRVFPWAGQLIVFALNGDIRSYSDANGWSGVLGTYVQPDAATPFRACIASKSFFSTSSTGINVQDAITNDTLSAGVPAPVPMLTSDVGGWSVVPTIGGFLAPGATVAYRALLCRRDANNNLIQSAPSPRNVLTNLPFSVTAGNLSKAQSPSTTVTATIAAHGYTSGMTVGVALATGESTEFAAGNFTITVTGINTFTYSDNVVGASGSATTNTQTDTVGAFASIGAFSWWMPSSNGATFAQLYRSASVPSGVAASDELFQVAEYALQTADYGAANFTFVGDNTLDTFLSIPLYTNASTGSGAAVANYQPPLAKDICLFNGRMLAANTVEPNSVQLQLIGTGGIAVGTSALQVAGITFTSSTTFDGTNLKFKVTTSGTAAQNIALTAQSLCDCINYTLNNPTTRATFGTQVCAYYTSTSNGAPGLITIQEVGVGGAAFDVQIPPTKAGMPGSWVPDLGKSNPMPIHPRPPGSYTTSSNNAQPAKLWWSNDGQPWGFGPNNWDIVFAADEDILRLQLVRQTVFIFKKDGVYTLTGDTPATYQIVPFDPTLVLLNPESCANVGNQIFCYTNRGEVYVSEAGVSPVISNPIQKELQTDVVFSPGYAINGFGVGYENEGIFLHAIPTSPNDPGCSQQRCFNVGKPGWTRWTLPGASHGCLNPATTGLVWAIGSVLWEERKMYNSSDFQDPTLTGTASSTTGSNQVTVTGAAVAQGDMLVQGTVVAMVTAVNGTTCTLDNSYSFTAASVGVCKAFTCTIKFLPFACQDPIRQKRFSHLYLSWKWCEADNLNIGWDSDQPNATTFISVKGPAPISWGSLAWGGAPWNQWAKNIISHLVPPQSMAVASTLGLTMQVQQAQCFWQLQGLKIAYDESGELPRR